MGVIQREVIAKRVKALLIFGGAHLYRHCWDPFSGAAAPQNLIDFLDQRAPGAVFVVMVHVFLERDAGLEQRLASWPTRAFTVRRFALMSGGRTLSDSTFFSGRSRNSAPPPPPLPKQSSRPQGARLTVPPARTGRPDRACLAASS